MHSSSTPTSFTAGRPKILASWPKGSSRPWAGTPERWTAGCSSGCGRHGSRLERQVDTELRKQIGICLTPLQDLAGISDSQANKVTDSVWKEQRLNTLFNQGLDCAAKQPEIHQPLSDHHRRRLVHVPPF